MSSGDCVTAEAPKGTPRQIARIVDLIAKSDLSREGMNKLAEYLSPLLKAIDHQHVPELWTFSTLVPALQAIDQWEITRDECHDIEDYLRDVCEAVVEGLGSRDEFRAKLGLPDHNLEITVDYGLPTDKAVARAKFAAFFTGADPTFFETKDRPDEKEKLFPKFHRVRDKYYFAHLESYLRERGLRGGTFEELLALTAQHPHIHKRYHAIIAPGTISSLAGAIVPNRAQYMPGIYEVEKRKKLGAFRIDYPQMVDQQDRLLVFQVID